MDNLKQVVVIGGGTGTYVALSGLKEYPVKLSAVVTMMDSGGSTGRLRDQLGVLPPGDIRQALVALSQSDDIWRRLFTYRFVSGELRGHNFGNIFLSALEKMTGSFGRAVETAEELLQTKGDILPVTFARSELCVELNNGRVIEGETHIDEPIEEERERIQRAFLKPKVDANPQALEAIKQSELILIGPGDLYTSLLVNLLVDGVVEAIRGANAKVVYPLNLMTKRGQTTNYTAADHVRDLETYLGKGILDVVLLNTAQPSEDALKQYAKHNEVVVEDDLQDKEETFEIVRGELLAEDVSAKQKGDKLRRSWIRHDPAKLAQVVANYLPITYNS